MAESKGLRSPHVATLLIICNIVYQGMSGFNDCSCSAGLPLAAGLHAVVRLPTIGTK